MGRSQYFVKRTLITVFLLWIAISLLFVLFRSMPGSFANQMVLAGASPETVAAFEQKWGLNDPLYVQYLNYMRNLLQADMGTSLKYRQPVIDVVGQNLFNSVILIAPGITTAYLLGMLYGVVAGNKKGSRFERYGIVPILLLGSFPSFVLAIFAVVIFATTLGWFPTSGLMDTRLYSQLAEIAWWRPYLTADFLHHATLPFVVIVLRYMYLPSLLMRTSVVEVSEQPFMFYHRITGMSQVRQLMALTRHASLPVITMYPISVARGIGGLVLIETVFSWPGVGFLLVESVRERDLPVVMFVFFLVAAFIIIANYVVDIVYGVIDPRISVTE